MAAEDGSNGAWDDDTAAVALLLLLLCFVSLPNKRLGSPLSPGQFQPIFQKIKIHNYVFWETIL